jgi:long-chain acyl-CoA synthetase
MQEYTTPLGNVHVADTDNMTTALFEHAQSHPARPALAERVGNQFVEWSTKKFADEVRAVAKGFAGLGIEPGSKICVMSETRLEWTVLDYAIWAAGCVTVPIYETSSAEQVEWIVSDSGAVAIICSNDDLKSIFDEVAGNLPDCKHAFVLDNGGLEQIKSAGGDVSDEEVDQRRASIGADDVATLVYTSGTTGRPKGCVLTHRNFLFDVNSFVSVGGAFFKAGESTLLFLPLAHIFGRIIQSACVEPAR